MKKSELKNIIKECVRELIFEENFLSPIISEVATGLNNNMLYESQKIPEGLKSKPNAGKNTSYKKLEETKRVMLDKIGKGSLNGVNVFEGINEREVQEKASPGIDLNKVPGLNISTEIMKKMR